MGVTWQDVQRWTPDPLSSSSQALSSQRRILEQAADDAAAALKSFHSTGEAAQAIRQSLTERVTELDRLVADVSELMMATADACDGVGDVRTKVLDCIDQAAIDSLTIQADGSVPWTTTTATGPSGYPVTTSNKAQADDLSELIATALTRADQVDQDYTRRLGAVRDGTYRLAEDHDSASQGLPDLPQKGWSATEVSTWWNALSPEERADILRTLPEAIGNLDGIDMTSRDQANRALLPGMIDAAKTQMDDAEAAMDQALKSGNGTWIQQATIEWARARDKVKDLEAVQTQIDAGDDRHLLLLDPSGDMVKAAIAVGDVDHATHVATFVPGMTTTVHGSMDDYAQRMERLRRTTRDQAGVPLDDVATIAWLGYEAPQSLDVASTAKAHAGADRLASFAEGIQSSRTSSGAGDPHQTVLGHSYGSTTAGMAVNQVREGVVDDLIMFGSPGSGVQDAREYSLDPTHVHVSAVPEGDIVQGIGPDWAFGTNPAKLEDINHLSGDATGSDKYDPDVPWWQFWDAWKNHSTYLDDNTKTLKDFARVVGGVQ